MSLRTASLSFVVASIAIALTGCADDFRWPGRFVSADGYEGQRTPGPYRDAGAVDDSGGTPGERTVEEGDIYRILDGDTLLNLNAYRGIQVIDLSDLSAPRVIGRLPMTGTPVEMYVVGTRAFVLLNAWSGYYGSRDDVRVERVEGGLLVSVDLSNRARPVEDDRALVPGWILTSRLAREGAHTSLYVAATQYDTSSGGGSSWSPSTVVKSFDVSAPEIAERETLELGGGVAAIQATPEALLVARDDWSSGVEGSLVSAIDISDPAGHMVEGAERRVAGRVAKQFNMDIYGGILRIVSGSTWGTASRINHLETFDASDLGTLRPIDHCVFGENEDLYATLFVDNRAFFVTYMRVDPFHAFYVDDDGFCDERSEFEVSGWNDFFRPVIDATRLVGIGVDDASGRRAAAVSLYDITDLASPNPLVARATVEADYTWSEAQWDHRAFSVLEGAVAVTAPDGTLENGLVLLPFSGWRETEQAYRAGVQIFTFSATTLTRRGVMEHGTPVRRSFQLRNDHPYTANLSDTDLSIFDTASPDSPEERGRVSLAPSYARALRFGDYLVRLEDSAWSYGWWGSRGEAPPSEVQVLAPGADPDMGTPIARFEVPQGARLYKVGHLLVSVASTPRDTSTWPYTWDTRVQVFDPTNVVPREVSSFTTDRIRPYYAWYYYGAPVDCFDCRGYGYYGGYDDLVRVAGDAIVFTRVDEQSELEGIEHVCYQYPATSWPCSSDSDTCTYYNGGITCRNMEGDPAVCEGSVAQCTWTRSTESYECVEMDPAALDMYESCYDQERRRYWQRFTFDVLDLSTPAAPRLAEPVEMPLDDEAVGLVAGESAVYYTYKRRAWVLGDDRPYVSWYFQPIDLGDASRPRVRASVNVPGELFSISGRTLLTKDLVWGEDVAETAVRRLVWRYDNTAELVASHRIADRVVDSLEFDGAGHLLVTHRAPWAAYYSGSSPMELTKLRVLDATSLGRLAETDIDAWATLEEADAGRALFQVPGGVLLVDVRDGTNPAAQAYFPTMGWPSDILMEGDDILIAAGPYGVYRFDATTRNLLER